MLRARILALAIVAVARPSLRADETPATPAVPRFQAADVFALESASDPRLAPDGQRVAYVRNSFDAKTDRKQSRLWVVGVEGKGHRPLVGGGANESSPRWSPDGTSLIYLSGGEIHRVWADTGRTAQLTRLPAGLSDPAAPAWSPDGRWVAFSAFVADSPRPFIDLPARPEGATWADPPRVFTDLDYRFDGEGYRKPGFRHLFVVPADGGAARQLTSGAFDHVMSFFHEVEEPSWAPDGRSLVIAARRLPDPDRSPFEADLFEVAVADGAIRRLTDRRGPDASPVVSPDGKRVAYLGFDDAKVAYQRPRLYVLNRDGTGRRELAADLDRHLSAPAWAADGAGVYVQFPERGEIKVALVPLDGKPEVVAEGVGGLDLGRPYNAGQFSVAGGAVAFTQSRPDRPADVAVRVVGSPTAGRLTDLNEGLLAHRSLGTVEETWFPSSHDGTKIQGWVVKPPGFDPKAKYPLVLEIHGGPNTDYGPSFAVEIQMYAAAGYVVLYANPRASTGYGETFAQQANGVFPEVTHDDLMAGVDSLLKQGFIDEKNLFITGGSAGGISTAWAVGRTDRFRAAVAAKPIVSWETGALTGDLAAYAVDYEVRGLPWEDREAYRKRSPLSLVGQVRTPTMLLCGEEDFRCPIAESEQFYTALKLRGIDTALVRFPGTSHAIVDRPSRQVAKPLCILKWFDSHRAR